ncbi:hypothetical protein PCC9214_00846 [Planktothrix tepida]|uniref:Phasin family protein n=2 Tax=Planktothrix TaxID=54304 RepID=A0A1J1LEZ7_9CYAN|nr:MULTISPECIES: phasin family protein [Planktothrix]MBD2480610.1 phasin family protein [Planktothrix sp. FACHB-1365]CAD5923994.1 hypothetical protein PCC9214_00846 [Planktothrix tepida]CAD5982057.1 hypothetical protein NO713_04927 [Planktothrix pseudagardhii]CUR31141.1 conserved hypothetical protein [Planktothrix tepida PCC 9214]
MDNQNNLLRQLLMIGIGTTSLVAEKLQEATDQWVKDGTMNTEQAKRFVDDMMQGLRLDHTSLEDLMQRQFRNLMQDVGVPRQSELDELRGRLDRLERQVRDLENRLWR